MAPSQPPDLTLDLVRQAHARIAPYVRRTPVLVDEWLDEAAGARLFFKCENLQHGGAFKARGATNAVLALADEAARRGVVTHSSGNHAAAIARAAGLRGIPAHVVMPSTSARAKLENVRRYGGRIVLCEPTLEARERAAAAIVAETGAAFIHPFDNLDVMAGQGTAALELLEDIPDLDVVVCPVGGGGLLSGTAVTVKAIRPGTRVVAAEPAEAGDAAQSFAAGRLIPLTQTATIADGLRTSLAERTFAVIRATVDEVVTVSEASIVDAMRTIWENLKVVVEPSAAVAYAPLVEAPRRWEGLRVGIILTGGNLDLDRLPWQLPRA